MRQRTLTIVGRMCLGTYGGAPFWLVGILWLYWIQILAYLLFGRIQTGKTGDQLHSDQCDQKKITKCL